MQLDRSGMMLMTAGFSYACQYGIVSLPWGTSILQDIGNVACGAGFFLFTSCAIAVLGGSILSPIVDKDGMPDLAVAGDWVPFWLLISTAILVVVIYKFPTTLDTIDLFFLLGITIRLVQWNGFEPNGLAEFEPAEELS